MAHFERRAQVLTFLSWILRKKDLENLWWKSWLVLKTWIIPRPRTNKFNSISFIISRQNHSQGTKVTLLMPRIYQVQNFDNIYARHLLIILQSSFLKLRTLRTWTQTEASWVLKARSWQAVSLSINSLAHQKSLIKRTYSNHSLHRRHQWRTGSSECCR